MMLKTPVAMIGVGKLGQSCAEVMAESYPVVGYDVAPRNPRNFNMVKSVEQAVTFADIIFIAAPTPIITISGLEKSQPTVPIAIR